jgi:late competence protein required for DNA uptake (superfamily II DNA/RNA helicase)
MVTLNAKDSKRFLKEITNKEMSPEQKAILDKYLELIQPKHTVHKINSFFRKRIKNNQCYNCGTQRAYSDKYDAYYCPKCVFWLEKICPDRKCEFCANRPKYPDLKKETLWNKKLLQ